MGKFDVKNVCGFGMNVWMKIIKFIGEIVELDSFLIPRELVLREDSLSKKLSDQTGFLFLLSLLGLTDSSIFASHTKHNDFALNVLKTIATNYTFTGNNNWFVKGGLIVSLLLDAYINDIDIFFTTLFDFLLLQFDYDPNSKIMIRECSNVCNSNYDSRTTTFVITRIHNVDKYESNHYSSYVAPNTRPNEIIGICADQIVIQTTKVDSVYQPFSQFINESLIIDGAKLRDGLHNRPDANIKETILSRIELDMTTTTKTRFERFLMNSIIDDIIAKKWRLYVTAKEFSTKLKMDVCYFLEYCNYNNLFTLRNRVKHAKKRGYTIENEHQVNIMMFIVESLNDKRKLLKQISDDFDNFIEKLNREFDWTI